MDIIVYNFGFFLGHTLIVDFLILELKKCQGLLKKILNNI